MFGGTASVAATQLLSNAVLIMSLQAALLLRLPRMHGKELTAGMATKFLEPRWHAGKGRFVFEQLCRLIFLIHVA